MPFGSVDPANLEGDELDAWYRRSPSEIEQARQAAAQRRYDAYFGASNDPPSDSHSVSSKPGEPGIIGNRAPAPHAKLASTAPEPPVSVVEDFANCPTCHGRAPLPPPAALPWPWSVGVYIRDSVGGGGSPPPRDQDPKQCEIQQRRDHEICGRQQNPRVRAVCRQRAATRYEHCLRTREVDSPIPLLWF